MTAMSIVSVIIPTFNCADYLSDAVESVLAQTLNAHEIIVVDDGSTDPTQELVQKWGGRVLYFRQPHSGVAAARNRGIEAATGEFIAFLDADDLWEPEKLARQLHFFQSEPGVAACFTNFVHFGPHGSRNAFDSPHSSLSRLRKRKVGQAAYVISDPTLFLDQLPPSSIPCLTSTLVVRRQCFEKVGRFDERLKVFEDAQMWSRLARYFTFGYIDEVLVRRRLRNESITASLPESEISHHVIQALETFPKWVTLSPDERRALDRRIARVRFSLGYQEFVAYRFAPARMHFGRALRAHFSLKSMAYFLLSCAPVRAVRVMRSLKHRFFYGNELVAAGRN